MAARREAIEVNRRYLNGLADITSSLRGEALRTKFSNKSRDATFQGRRLITYGLCLAAEPTK
jgi:hypothetical protein